MTKSILILTLGAMLFLGSGLITGQEADPAPEAVAPLTVTVATPLWGGVSEDIPASGVTVPREEIQVMTELSGTRVQNLLAEVGDWVEQGQALAILDGEAQRNEVARLKSDYDRARDASTRADALKDSGAVTRQSVVDKHGAMLAAKAQLDNAELNLRRATVRAPRDGLIYERNAVIGTVVQDDTPLFRMARHGEIELEAMVPESHLTAITPGQAVSVQLMGADAPVKGHVRQVAPRVDGTTRMARIRVALTATGPLPVGLFATARIALPERVGMLLPRTAIQRDGAGDFVWVVDNRDRAGRQPVEVILFREDLVVIKDIPAETRVIARAGAFVHEGDPLRVTGSQ